MAEIPEHIRQYINEAQDVFGLAGWHISVKMTDKPGGSEQNWGRCATESVYLNASIEISTDIDNEQRAREVCYHEVIHAAHASIDRVVNRILDELPKKQRRLFSELYTDEVERFTQRTSRSICETSTSEKEKSL